MNWKDFFKPTKWKLLILLVIGLSVAILSVFVFIGYITTYGYPLPLAKAKILGSPGGPGMLTTELSYLNIMIDLIIWYLISCLIVSVYNKVRKK